MFTIRTSHDIDPLGLGVWEVRGEWFGQLRAVFVGPLLECCRFVAAQR